MVGERASVSERAGASQGEKMMRIVCHMRCSTGDKQTVESQRTEIEAYLAARSPKRVRWFEDVGHTAASCTAPRSRG